MLRNKKLAESFRSIILFVSLFSSFLYSYAQTFILVSPDTAVVSIDTLKIWPVDSSLMIPSDSLQILKKDIRSAKAKKAFKIFSYLKYKDSGNNKDFTGVEKYKQYKGKKIRSIQISIINPFGSIVEDSLQPLKKGQKFANKIHFKSKEWFVKNDILFHEGDKVVPSLFADTEKLLWGRRKFKDISILLTEDSTKKNVDVIVYLQDKLSWEVGLGYNDRLIAGISTYNFFGQPNTLSVFAGINLNKYNLWAAGGAYKYENIKSSQINIATNFLIEKLNQNAVVSLYRNFFSINTQWAFDVKYSYDYSTNSLTNNLKDTTSYIRTKSNYYSLWLAYALPFSKIMSIKDDKLKLIFATKIDNTHYKKRPFMDSRLYDKIFVSQQNYRVGIGVARWDYYLAKNSFYIDVAEFFPRGYSASFWVGSQFDEYYGQRISFDFTVNYGIHVNKFGYLYPQYNYNGYIRHKKGEEMISKISLDFVSDKVALAKIVYFRQILKLGTSLGASLPADRYFNINETNGIRGFYSPFLKGSKSAFVNMECDIFFDKKIALTKAMTYVFCDMAWLSENKRTLFSESVFQYGLGFGLRLRSAELGVPYVDVQFSFYPRGKDFGEKIFQFHAMGSNPNAIIQNNMFVEQEK